MTTLPAGRRMQGRGNGRQKLQKAFQALKQMIVDAGAKRGDEARFFSTCRRAINEVAAGIAAELGADSSGIFFVEEDGRGGRRLVLQGASGRLARLQASGSHRQDYSSMESALLVDPRMALGVTHQVWHHAEGRIANSNAAMDSLGKRRTPAGSADSIVYQGSRLAETFRTFLAVPIFAPAPEPRGAAGERLLLGACDPMAVDFEEAWRAALVGSTTQAGDREAKKEFLATHRVIGLLKLENKRPTHRPTKDWLASRLRDGYPGAKHSAISKNPAHIFDGDGPRFASKLVGRKNLRRRATFADMCSEAFGAVFTNDDVQLAVLIAMELGRIPAWWTIARAGHISPSLALTEDEIRRLSIRGTDIDPIKAGYEIAGDAVRYAEYALRTIVADLDHARSQQVSRELVGQTRPRSSAAREIRGRAKPFASLVQKILRKIDRGQADSVLSFKLSDGSLNVLASSDKRESTKLVGVARVFLERSEAGDHLHNVRVGGILEQPGEGRASLTIDLENVTSQLKTPLPNDKVPFVRRILHENAFAVDDWAGVRVVADYESDLLAVLDELRSECARFGFEILAVDDFRQGKPDGYRAIHVMLGVDLARIGQRQKAASSGVTAALISANRSSRYHFGGRTWFPVEVQLRTGYQDSWAAKTHALWYKRESDLPWELRKQQRTLSDVLGSADSLSDLVRVEIQGALDSFGRAGVLRRTLPIKLEEERLVDFLRIRISRDALYALVGAMEASRCAMEDRLRYGGDREHSFSLEVCRHLVYRWQTFDPHLLAVAFLRNVWLAKTPGSLLRERLGRLPIDRSVQRHLEEFLDRSSPAAAWFDRLMGVFKAYFQDFPPRSGTVIDAWLGRVRTIAELGKEDAVACQKGLLLEAAILLANLAETSDEPSSAGRRISFSRKCQVFELIRKVFPSSPLRRQILSELDLAIHDVQAELGFSREPVPLDQ